MKIACMKRDASASFGCLSSLQEQSGIDVLQAMPEAKCST